MSLRVQFKISVAQDCKSIILTDTTGNGSDGYGGQNTSWAGVSKVRIIVLTQDKHSFELSRGPLSEDRQWIISASDLGQGELVAQNMITDDCDDCDGIFMGNILFSRFLPYAYYNDPYCGDPCSGGAMDLPVFPGKFEDMCYTITYEVYSKSQVPNYSATYALTMPHCDNRYVFARVNGAWYDITGEMIHDRGEWGFLKTNTRNRYDLYELRDIDGNVYAQGVFTVSDIVSQGGLTATEEHTIVSAKTVRMPFLCVLTNVLNQAMYKIRMEPECLLNDIGNSQALSIWSLAYARLRALIEDPVCGCDEAMNTSAQIREMMISLFGIEPSYVDCDECN